MVIAVGLDFGIVDDVDFINSTRNRFAAIGTGIVHVRIASASAVHVQIHMHACMYM